MVASWIAVALLLQRAAFLGFANALSDGDSLLAAKSVWNTANLSTWTGNDPCHNNWEGVQCNSNNRVTYLNLSNKGITGLIPKQIANLQYLEILDLSNPRHAKPPINQITGGIPVLGGLTNLKILYLTFNAIKLDQFPEEVLNLKNLTDLRIDNNLLQGALPTDLSKLTKLQYLYLGNNTLMSGPLPPEWGDLVNLLELSLWNNPLQSEIPPEFGKLVNLRYLNLHNCFLYGGLPAELGNIKSFTNISLYENDLTGPIPDSWRNLTNLQALLLHNNYLTKGFPNWIEELPHIVNVSLGYNYFYGPVPSLHVSSLKNLSITCNFFSGQTPTENSIIFNHQGNCFVGADTNEKIKCGQSFACNTFEQNRLNGNCPYCPATQYLQDQTSCVCTKGQGESGGGSHKAKLIGSIIGVGLFLIIIASLLWWRWIKVTKEPVYSTSRYATDRDPSSSFEVPGVQRFTIQEINRATEGFNINHEIGIGGSGRVFYGVLDDGRKVAIKRAESIMQSSSVFRNEVILLSRLHHRNLVRLVGFCEDHGVQILVYEYMPKGDLQTCLFKNKGGDTLDWLRRLDIAAGIAQGLEYLHSFADPPVIHRDVKPSNVLLDDNMVAKLADFGLSRATPEFDSIYFTKLAGTVGYMDPQYILRQHLTTASDVYSFGMVLLELLSGQKSIDHSRLDDQNLIEWVKVKLNNGRMKDIVDPRLGDNYPEQVFQDLVRLGIDCASFRTEDRPSMKAVVTILDACLRAVPPDTLRVVHDAQIHYDDDVSEDYSMNQMADWQLLKNTENAFIEGSSGSLTMTLPLPR